MLLSYSTINGIKNCHYFWICKTQELDTIDFSFFEKGKKIHRQIQDHVSGRVIDDSLTERGLDPNKWYFPIVEEMDRDPNCHFEFEVDGHKIHGYFDGLKPEEALLEIKSGTYSPRDFMRSYQRKIYALALNVPRSVLIYSKDEFSKISTTIIQNTEKDKEEALKWIREGINIIKSGDFEPKKDRDCFRCIFRDSCDRSLNARN